MMLAFVPIALMVPLSLKLIGNWLLEKYHSKNGLRLGLIGIIAVLFAISGFYAVSFSFSGMKYYHDQYNDLVQIKANS